MSQAPENDVITLLHELRSDIGQLGERLGGVEERLGRVETTLAAVDARTERVEARLLDIEQIVVAQPDLTLVLRHFKNIEQGQRLQASALNDLATRVESLERRR